MKTNRFVVCTLVLLAGLGSSEVLAANFNVSVKRQGDSGPVSGVTVMIEGPGQDSLTRVTDGNGYASFGNISNGVNTHYTIAATYRFELVAFIEIDFGEADSDINYELAIDPGVSDAEYDAELNQALGELFPPECVPDASCAASTCSSETCTDACGNSYPGTMYCPPPPPRKHVAGDLNGDGKADTTIYRPSQGMWYGRGSSNYDVQFGLPGDIPLVADFNGDGVTDFTVFRPSDGTWWVKSMIAGQPWGWAGDIPVPADYDGDRRADIAVWRPSDGTWYVIRSSTSGYQVVQWGLAGDVPVPGDYDGDGRTDMAVWRPSSGHWFVINSSNSAVHVVQWGLAGDIAVPGDYDGDGRTDMAVWRPSSGYWFVINSSNAALQIVQWGLWGDVPVPGDYSGDGRTDFAVYRPSTAFWHVANVLSLAHGGIPGDIPLLRKLQ